MKSKKSRKSTPKKAEKSKRSTNATNTTNRNHKNPQLLFNALCAVSGTNVACEYPTFKGIYNRDSHDRPANYCYVISFLQLLFHSKYVLNYLRKEALTNRNELLLINFLQNLYEKNSAQAVKLDDFVTSFRGWEGRRKIPNEQCDVMDFVLYLFNSVSDNFSNLFDNDLIGQNEKDFQLDDDVIQKNFLIKLPISNNSIQNLIDNKLRTVVSIGNLPNCLLVCLLRQDTDSYNKQCVSVNSFIF